MRDKAKIKRAIESGSYVTRDKISTTRMQLTVLLHVLLVEDLDENTHRRICKMPFCQSGQAIIRHIKTCTAANDCLTVNCKLSRELLAHWEDCKHSDVNCEVCTPVKKSLNDRLDSLRIPDSCRAARKLITHYKDCTSVFCRHCEQVDSLKKKVCGTNAFSPSKMKHSGLLFHCCRCEDRACKNPMCIKMKQVLTHTNVCQCKTPNLICRKISLFCIQHCIGCNERDCILSTGLKQSQ